MKKEKRLTRREKKAQNPAPAQVGRPKAKAAAQHQHSGHIHCVACGKHLDAHTFGEAEGAAFTRCAHGTDFPHCTGCAEKAGVLIREHDDSNRPIKSAAAWH